MKTYCQHTCFAGFDWAKDHHDVVIIDLQGGIIDQFRIEHSVAGWQIWKQKVAAHPEMGVVIETNFGSVVEYLLDSKVTVYPVHPVRAKRYRERQCTSGNKTDLHDAWAMADALRVDGHSWRPLTERDPLIAQLRVLCRDEVALIGERTALVNQLQQALREYYPTALEAFDDWTASGAWAFVEAFPSAGELTQAGKRKWDKFLHSHKLYRSQTYENRIAAFQRADQWVANPSLVAAKSLYAVARCKQLRALQAQLDLYRQRIEALFVTHEDHNIFSSLPGAGPKLSPRLLAEIGSDRALYSDAGSLQCLAGTAPVSFQSGLIHKVRMRHSCNLNLRATMHLFADHSRKNCVWAAIYYAAQIQRGKTHAQSLRCLGQRWLKIIWKMWQTHTCYDPDLHARNQTAHGSWVLNFNPQTKSTP
jgi:transposase